MKQSDKNKSKQNKNEQTNKTKQKNQPTNKQTKKAINCGATTCDSGL